MIRTIVPSLLISFALAQAASVDSPKAWVKATGKPVSMINSIQTFANGDLVFSGHFEQGAQLDTADMKPLSGMPSSDFVGMVDAAGKVKWVKPVGPGLMVAQALALDAQGNIIIGASLYCASKFHRVGRDSVDVTRCSESWYVVKLDSKGEVQWARDWTPEAPGDHRNGKLAALSVGPDGAVYVAGSSSGEVVKASPLEVEAVQFVAKFDAQGNRLWKKLVRYDGDGGLKAIAAHSDGNVYVTGWFNTIVQFRKTGGAWDDSLLSAGAEDIFMASFSADGTLRFTKRAGGAGTDIAARIAVDGSGFRIGGTLEGEGDLANLKDPFRPHQPMVGRFDGNGNTLGYAKSDLTNGKLIAWSLAGASTHLLVESDSKYHYIRMAPDRVVSSEVIDVRAMRAPGDTSSGVNLEALALDPWGVPVVAGETVTDVPDGFRWDAFVVKWSNFSWVSIRKPPLSRHAGRIHRGDGRDLLGRWKTPWARVPQIDPPSGW